MLVTRWLREAAHHLTDDRTADHNQREITLRYKDAYIIPADVQEVRVTAGRAWLSVRGDDVVLGRGQRFSLGSNRGTVVVTALGRKPVSLELRS
jgi:hypothetical protein